MAQNKNEKTDIQSSGADKAMGIATAHLRKMNPSSWSGSGSQPDGFNPVICTYQINNDTELDVSFEKDPKDGWYHLCELRDRQSGELLEILSGYGIDSLQNLADTISDICKELL